MCFIYIIYAYLLYQVSNLPDLFWQEMARNPSLSENLIQAQMRPRSLFKTKTELLRNLDLAPRTNLFQLQLLFQRHVSLPLQVLFLLELFIKRKTWGKDLKLKSNFQAVSPSPQQPFPDLVRIWPESKDCCPGKTVSCELSLPHPGRCWESQRKGVMLQRSELVNLMNK